VLFLLYEYHDTVLSCLVPSLTAYISLSFELMAFCTLMASMCKHREWTLSMFRSDIHSPHYERHIPLETLVFPVWICLVFEMISEKRLVPSFLNSYKRLLLVFNQQKSYITMVTYCQLKIKIKFSGIMFPMGQHYGFPWKWRQQNSGIYVPNKTAWRHRWQ
jgi:hypothetical protein